MQVGKYKRTDRSILIAIEGIDGCGKDAVAEPLAEHLREKGLEVMITAEPRYIQEGALIRELIKENDVDDTRLSSCTLLTAVTIY